MGANASELSRSLLFRMLKMGCRVSMKETKDIELDRMAEDDPTFLVWDGEGVAPKGKWTVVLWRTFKDANEPSVYSIPKLVEKQAHFLRARYLAWIYELGEAYIGRKRLVDHLELRPGFSYWWMTLLVYKANAYSSPQIVDAIKMFALQDLVDAHLPSRIVLISGNRILACAFRLWCKNADIGFEWRKLRRRTTSELWFKKFYRPLPHPVRAMIGLTRYIINRWPLRQIGAREIAGSDAFITFFSYLFNLSRNSLQAGRFATSYWTALHEIVERLPAGVNWLHKYFKHEAVSSTRQARTIINKFNRRVDDKQAHTSMDGLLSWSIISGTILDYVRVVKACLCLRNARCLFQPLGLNIDFWPLFKEDWRKSMYGVRAISNSLDINLSEHTLQKLTRQRLGFYLQENQPWERALIHSWNAAGHGILIGVPHTTVSYWDLRHFYDPRAYQRTGKNDLPLPYMVALNGPAAMATYLNGGYPKSQITEVEALRYLYLSDLKSMQSGANKRSINSLRILILGDYTASVTHRQVEWLVAAAPSLSQDTHYTVKPHPACPVDPSDYPSLELHMTTAPLQELLPACDVAYTSNITTAAVDAYCSGVFVVSVLDGETLNMSPLRGLEGVAYVTGPRDLAKALSNVRPRKNVASDGFFYLDKELPRWRKVLSLT